MPLLEARGLRKVFGTLVAVDDVDLTLDAGQVIGLIGPNGAGKTTLLRMLATLLPPTGGTARCFGHDVARDYLAVRRRLGYLPDFFNLYSDLTLAECLTFFAAAYGADRASVPGRVGHVLELVDLADKRDDLIRHLSRGMVQRLGLATQLIHEPELLLLDEPASGLDPLARIQLRGVLQRLRGEGKALVVSSHILPELAGFCTHLAIMNHGRMVVHGAVDEVERRLSGARRARLTVLGDLAEAARLAAASPAVRILNTADDHLLFEFDGGPATLVALNRELVTAGVAVVGLSEEKASLEDVFLQIASGEDHDAA